MSDERGCDYFAIYMLNSGGSFGLLPLALSLTPEPAYVAEHLGELEGVGLRDDLPRVELLLHLQRHAGVRHGDVRVHLHSSICPRTVGRRRRMRIIIAGGFGRTRNNDDDDDDK